MQFECEQEFAESMPEPVQEHVVYNLQGPSLMYHVVLSSYTLQNVLNGTILSTKTDLGYFSDPTQIDITKLIKDLQTYTIPEDIPQWRLDMVNSWGTPPEPQFNLIIELVGINGY